MSVPLKQTISGLRRVSRVPCWLLGFSSRSWFRFFRCAQRRWLLFRFLVQANTKATARRCKFAVSCLRAPLPLCYSTPLEISGLVGFSEVRYCGSAATLASGRPEPQDTGGSSEPHRPPARRGNILATLKVEQNAEKNAPGTIFWKCVLPAVHPCVL